MHKVAEEERLEEVECNLCGASDANFWCYTKESSNFHAAAQFQVTKRFPVVRCKACGLVYISPRYSAEKRRALYCDEGLFTGSADPEGRPRSYIGERELKQAAFRPLIGRLERFQRGGRLLDVGSGPGFFLDLLGPHWQGEGLDPSSFASRYARRKLGIKVEKGKFETGKYAPATFAAVTMLQVLDHLPDPLQSLREVHRLLVPGGVLMLSSVVNIDSYCARMFGAGYRLLAPNHLYYFSPRTLRRILRMAGFEVREVRYPYLRTPYCNLRELGKLVRGTLRVLCQREGNRQPVLSPPFYGNMMDAIAAKPA